MVRTAHGKTGQFEIEVGLHQGSGLSPFLFTMVLDTISEECRNGLPWELLFADDLAIVADSEEDLQRRMAEVADWNGEQGTESEHREI